MAMNREIEAHMAANAGNPQALQALEAMQTQFNLLRDANILKERPVEVLAETVQAEANPATRQETPHQIPDFYVVRHIEKLVFPSVDQLVTTARAELKENSKIMTQEI